jgi:hypothetical protein
VGNRPAGGIGLIFAYDLEALLAAVVPAHGDGHAEGSLAFVGGKLDDFRAREPRPPQYRISREAAATASLSPLSVAARWAASKRLSVAFMAASPVSVTKLR